MAERPFIDQLDDAVSAMIERRQTDLTSLEPRASSLAEVARDLVGLPREDVRLVGGPDSHAALVIYGQGLGAIVVVERKPDATQGQNGSLSSLPTISLDGVTAHELGTQLGTVLEWQRPGTAYVLAGSLPPAAAEAAARQLK